MAAFTMTRNSSNSVRLKGRIRAIQPIAVNAVTSTCIHQLSCIFLIIGNQKMNPKTDRWTHEIASHSHRVDGRPRSSHVHGNGRDHGPGCGQMHDRRRERSPHALRRDVEAKEDQEEGITGDTAPLRRGFFFGGPARWIGQPQTGYGRGGVMARRYRLGRVALISTGAGAVHQIIAPCPAVESTPARLPVEFLQSTALAPADLA
jgi:hypothetical protein